MDEGVERFVERMGLLWEADGLPRIAGRILGYLMLAPGESSLEELAQELAVSRASVSNDARRLEQMGILERRSRPADRRDYYAVSPGAFRRSVEARLARLRELQLLVEEGRALAGDDPGVQRRLRNWETAHRLLQASLERLRADIEAAELTE